MNIVELTGEDLNTFLTACDYMGIDGCSSLKIAIDDIDKALKLKVDNGTWSPPMGVIV